MRTRLLAVCLVLAALLSPRAEATWSIVVVDDATGEVAVASATCLPNIDLKRFLPVIVVGKGAGAAQALIDVDVQARMIIRQGLIAGLTPEQIVAQLQAEVSQPNVRQWGVAAPGAPAASATGDGAGDFKGELVGSVGTLRYTIQGNVITGLPVLEAAERALRGTPGRLSDRLMAAMEAAMLMGGDGRCSCAPDDPTGCGSPPAAFEKSADVGFLIVARVGDLTGLCNALGGCAQGRYWLELNVVAPASAPDPVLTLREGYEHFLTTKRDRADGLLSEVSWSSSPGASRTSVPADGRSARVLDITLRDVFGEQLSVNPERITADHHGTSDGVAERFELVDLGAGRLQLRVLAGTRPGTDVFRLRVVDPSGVTVLYPLPVLEHLALDD